MIYTFNSKSMAEWRLLLPIGRQIAIKQRHLEEERWDRAIITDYANTNIYTRRFYKSPLVGTAGSRYYIEYNDTIQLDILHWDIAEFLAGNDALISSLVENIKQTIRGAA